MRYKTEQENFWATDFGNEYVNRNNSQEIINSRTFLFTNVLNRTIGVKSIIEFGANIGLNLHAIKKIMPSIDLAAVEINSEAVSVLRKNFDMPIFEGSILDYESQKKYDLAFTSGVLIHINPSELQNVYAKLYDSSNKYILVNEYYNPTPVAIDYRNNKDKLFKRDFAGEIMDKYPNLKLVDYGFIYHRDNNFSADDLTWFLLSK